MATVPIGNEELEVIVSECARDLIERRAMAGKISEDSINESIHDAIDDTAFIINKFMSYMNEAMAKYQA